MPKIFKLVIRSLMLTFCFAFFCNTLNAQRHYKLAEKKIEADRIKIEKLNARNRELESTISSLRYQISNNRKNKDKALQNALNELFANNAVLQRKENELVALRNSLRLLSSENNLMRNQNNNLQNQNYRQQGNINDLVRKNDMLQRRINQVTNDLYRVNEHNRINENRIAENLKEINRLNLVIRAKDKAIADLIYKYERKRNYYGVSGGFGTDYSGAGVSLSSRWGRLMGFGLHVGTGYLPLPDKFLQTEVWSYNGGINIYFNRNLYLDATLHMPIWHVKGYEYDRALSLSVGGNYFPDSTKPYGAKLSAGLLISDSQFRNEIAFTMNGGIFVKLWQ